jgi:hypothetical protein
MLNPQAGRPTCHPLEVFFGGLPSDVPLEPFRVVYAVENRDLLWRIGPP